MADVKTTVTHTTETVSGREYPLTITRQTGLQEIMVSGEPVLVERVTIFESLLGTSRCYTRARPEQPPVERAAVRRRAQEVATKAMIDQGVW